MVSLYLPIVRVQVFLGLFSIGLTLTTFTWPEIGSGWLIWTFRTPWSHLDGKQFLSSNPHLYCFSFHFFSLMKSYSFLQTRKFSFKVLVRVNSVLKVRLEAAKKYGYHLQRDGWLNTFTDEKCQAMRSDGVPWRGTRKKHHVFFSIIFATLTNKNNIIMDWQCGVGKHYLSASSLH